MKTRFTLIELLMVITVIGILASIILPSLQEARKKSKLAVCKNNMKQQGIAMTMYLDDIERDRPFDFYEGTGDYYNEQNHLEDFIPYSSTEILFCPTGDKDESDYDAAGDWSGGYTYYYSSSARAGLESEGIVTGDMSATWNEYTSEIEHYNALFIDGSVIKFGDNFAEFSDWLDINVVNP